jgi:hypothetical protein
LEDAAMMRATALALVLLGGCQNGTAPPPPPPDLSSPPASMSAIHVGRTQQEVETGMAPASFNFSVLRDVWVRVTVPALPGTAQRTVQFVNPKGEIQYEEQLPYSTDPSVKEINVPGMMFPVQVVPAVVLPSGGVALDRVISITAIGFQRLPYEGDWLVRGRVEGVPGEATTMIRVTAR